MVVLFAALVVGCGGAGASGGANGPDFCRPHSDEAIVRWQARAGASSAPREATRASEEGDGDRFATRRIPGRSGVVRDPRGGERVDADFDDADLVNALRFLAERAGVSLVVDEGVTGRVDLSLREVDPLEMIFVLARVHGARATRPAPGLVVVRAAH
ncbi:MAG TPA: hypothetical protein RMF84_09340 [Polyangiaceae bacterium LLY-WYZ-14_1]|nr:hypothetical protein [Polyangiaceae bacterium LLY-WYZ-14_1]